MYTHTHALCTHRFRFGFKCRFEMEAELELVCRRLANVALTLHLTRHLRRAVKDVVYVATSYERLAGGPSHSH
jgi:hypothetical protein